MPSLPPRPSWASRAALTYLTLGALLTVWAIVGGLYVYRHPPRSPGILYLGAGVLGTGLVLAAIGLSLGWIARSARQAEMPPK